MNYENLKVIWDTQSDQPLFTVEREAVLASVQGKCASIEKGVRLTERILIPCALFAGIPLVLQLFIDSEPSWISFGVGLLFVVKAIFTWILLKKRQQRERSYGEAIVPSIEKAMLQNKHLAIMLKRWLIFFHLPAAVLALIGLIYFPTDDSSWMWILFVAVVAYSLYDTPRYLRNTYTKEQKNLEAIRSRLLETNQ